MIELIMQTLNVTCLKQYICQCTVISGSERQKMTFKLCNAELTGFFFLLNKPWGWVVGGINMALNNLTSRHFLHVVALTNLNIFGKITPNNLFCYKSVQVCQQISKAGQFYFYYGSDLKTKVSGARSVHQTATRWLVTSRFSLTPQ